MWKRKRQRAAFEKVMAALEEATAGLVRLFASGQWDAALYVAADLEVNLKPLATVPRMGICLYHAESIQLRIAYRRRDVRLIRLIAGKSHDQEVSEQAFDALRKMPIRGTGRVVDRVWHELEGRLGFLSNAEAQIRRMRYPHPSLIGTVYFPNLYVPDDE